MKTIEQASSENIKKIRVNSANLDHIKSTGRINGSLYIDLVNLSKSMVEFAQRWISVEEELPETNEFEESKICLIKNRHAIDIGRYYSNKKRWFLSSSNFEVTHWRYVEIQ